RILGPHYPDPVAVERELEALAKKEEPAAKARIAALRARMTEAPRVGSGRAEHLVEKLEHAADEAITLAWERDLHTKIETALAARLCTDSVAWAMGDEQLEVLAGMAELESDERALAARILSVRAGPPPWDLRSHPANRRFLESLHARGIDPR